MRVRELVGAGDLEESEFAGMKPDELQPDWQIGSRESARDGNGGNAGKIGGAVEAKEQGSRGIVFFRDARGFLSDKRRRDGSGRNDESINTCIAHLR